jgi:hypothetical protein
VFKGKLTSEVEVEGTKITLSTLSAPDEVTTYELLGVKNIGEDMKKFKDDEVLALKHATILLRFAIKKVNGVPISRQEVESILVDAELPFITTLYQEYGKMIERSMAAGKEIKN